MTVHFHVDNLEFARLVANILFDRSAWFNCTPLPDNEWGFEVKDEGHLEYIQKEYSTYAQSLHVDGLNQDENTGSEYPPEYFQENAPENQLFPND
jgi:hypothetical protein